MFGLNNKVKKRIEFLRTIRLETPNEGNIELSDWKGQHINCDTAQLLFAYDYITSWFYRFSYNNNPDFIVKFREDYYRTSKGEYVMVLRNCENGKVILCKSRSEESVKEVYFKMKSEEYARTHKEYCGIPFTVLVDNYKLQSAEI